MSCELETEVTIVWVTRELLQIYFQIFSISVGLNRTTGPRLPTHSAQLGSGCGIHTLAVRWPEKTLFIFISDI